MNGQRAVIALQIYMIKRRWPARIINAITRIRRSIWKTA